MESPLDPPRAEARPRRLEHHGHARLDEYAWLAERDDPRVRAHLEAENRYTASQMAPYAALEQRLFEEIKGRVKQSDQTVPYRLDDHFYYARFVEGQAYPLHCRRHRDAGSPEQVLLDVNALAAGQAYCSVGRLAVSSGQDVLAYAVDTAGRRIHTVHFKDLTTGREIAPSIPETTESLAWAEDGRTLFYVRQDPRTLRPCRVFRHLLGDDPARDELVYEESDEAFALAVFKTKSKRFVMIAAFQTLSSEYRFVAADDPCGTFRVFRPRERDHEYALDHHGDWFYVRTNAGAPNFRLVRTPLARTDAAHWQELVAHRDDVLLEEFELFAEHLVTVEREQGLVRIRVRAHDGGLLREIGFDDPVYLAGLERNPQLDTPWVRVAYQSLTTPHSVYDHDMRTGERTLLKRDEVLLGFDSAHYASERLWATAADGARVPLSIVYRRGLARDGSHPLLLYGYGAYGLSLDAGFQSARVSLLDRGFVFALAHVRGGQELGRAWYDQGRLLHKRNSFDDFIAAAEHLVARGYTSPARLMALGGSAGGLLVGAVINQRPELFCGAVAQVPFVDVLTTMLDPSLPLTAGEYDEWGDPRERRFYDYILSYSPYDNVEAKPYPHLLVLAGLHDSQVQYWEPAKWVARLRARQTGDRLLLLKTDLEAGHSGASGRFKRWQETAFIYSFLLRLAGPEYAQR